jgi:cytoskeleton protein RodZ
MGTLGERFRRERELRGIALSEIAAKTHIGARLLQAIEEEAYERLPGGIFNKSFIRQYAAYLGLDEEQAVRDYLRATGGSSNPQQTSVPEPEPATGGSFGTITRVAIAAVLLAAVGLGGYLLHHRSSQSPRATKVQFAVNSPLRASSSPPGGVSPATLPPPATGRSAEPPSSSAEPGPVSAKGEPIPQAPQSGPPQPSPPGAPSQAARSLAQPNAVASASTAAPGELLLQINASSTVWISVTADGEKKWQGTLQANQTREIQATDTIRLTAGNAGGVSLKLNGKDIGAMGNEGEVKTITLVARALAQPVP